MGIAIAALLAHVVALGCNQCQVVAFASVRAVWGWCIFSFRLGWFEAGPDMRT